jgi:hypothetical protein
MQRKPATSWRSWPLRADSHSRDPTLIPRDPTLIPRDPTLIPRGSPVIASVRQRIQTTECDTGRERSSSGWLMHDLHAAWICVWSSRHEIPHTLASAPRSPALPYDLDIDMSVAGSGVPVRFLGRRSGSGLDGSYGRFQGSRMGPPVQIPAWIPGRAPRHPPGRLGSRRISVGSRGISVGSRGISVGSRGISGGSRGISKCRIASKGACGC